MTDCLTWILSVPEKGQKSWRTLSFVRMSDDLKVIIIHTAIHRITHLTLISNNNNNNYCNEYFVCTNSPVSRLSQYGLLYLSTIPLSLSLSLFPRPSLPFWAAATTLNRGSEQVGRVYYLVCWEMLRYVPILCYTNFGRISMISMDA